MNHKSDDVRGKKKKPEDEGDREDTKRPDSMIVSCLNEEKSTNRDTHGASRTRGRYHIGRVEESGDKNENMAMYVPTEEGFEQELTEAWDDISRRRTRPRNGEEGTCPRDGMVQEHECV